jgi:presequence protease
MAIVHGFELLREHDIRELQTRAQLFRHVKTGAELLSLINRDENKVFGIAFRTPANDSTGVAHILEHSVLCGSRKYPVKEPFVELLKGSLKTFLNAMTYPDKTCYPVASQNLQDFYNLIDVYLDAVFYPRLTPFTLQQEGWHLELDAPDGELTCQGVVLNEMRGAYSSPDSVLLESSQQSLFPDSTYGFDSGGNPREIPRLTFEQFLAFHHSYYHPSNARITFYGDDDPENRLRLLDDYLKDFEQLESHSVVGLQPRLSQPQRTTRSYAAGESKEMGRKGMLTMNWLLPESIDVEMNLAFHALEYILLGMPASPLRKALIESGLGEDLAGTGLEAELRQMYFSTGLKGIDPDSTERIETLILQTLNALVKEGIHPHTLEAALNTMEFRLRENNTGAYPRGLILMLRALTSWLHDADPIVRLAFEAPLANLKTHAASQERFFERLIDEHLLSNQHRTTVILVPDPHLGAREEAAEQERLAGIRAAMTPAEVQETITATRKLKELQAAPDPPEALATIPTLKIADLDRTNKSIPLMLLEANGVQIYYHDLPTNAIAYLDVGFNLHLLAQKYLPYVPLFGRALVEMGTAQEDYVTLTRRISRKTGGIQAKTYTSMVRDSQQGLAWLFLRGKAMLTQTGELLDIIRDVLLTLRLDNPERFRQMVLEEKARHEQSLVPAGHQIVSLRLRSHFNEADWVAEQMSGLNYLFFLRNMARLVDEDWPRVLGVLEELRRILVNRNGMILNITLDASGWSQFEPQVRDFLTTLPQQPFSAAAWLPEEPPPGEGMIIPAQVNYVGKGANLYRLGYRHHGSAQVITRYLRTSWLWDRVRVQGGAYGAFCQFSSFSGVLSFVSYRDPHLLKTLETFDQAARFLKDTDLDGEELNKAIIGAIGDIDAYMLPDAKGFASMIRHLSNATDEYRQQVRDEVLSTTVADFRAFAEVLNEVNTTGLVKVLGSESAIAKAVSERPGWLHVFKVM